MYRIIVYGIGEQYNKNLNILKYYELTSQFDVVGVTAKWTPDSLNLDGYRVIKLDELQSYEYDFIIIMSDIYFREIVNELVNIGIERTKIINYRVLQIHNLDFDKYINLKKSNLSIISNNCWGGVAYHTLGLECLSPFKNLSVEDEDYIRLLKNLKYYMKCDMKFMKYAYNVNSKKDYPVMLLDDIKIHCNHDLYPDEAVEKWIRRRDKINYNNILVEMYTEKENVMQEFLEISEFNKKICFVPFETSLENTYQLYLYPGQTKFWETVNSNAGNGSNCLVYNLFNLITGMESRRNIGI
jgi:uncharacterized protein (DUF1919 family)